MNAVAGRYHRWNIQNNSYLSIRSVTKQLPSFSKHDENKPFCHKVVGVDKGGQTSLQTWAYYLCTLREWWFVVFRRVVNIQTNRIRHVRILVWKIRSILRTCTGGKYGKYMVIFGIPCFLGVVSACACYWYQATFHLLSRPGYEATRKLNQSVGISDKLAWMCFELFVTVNKRHK